ncbi:MAG: DeoR/GlpR family DNA-binding transcription regulator [bacterium]|jgi:DeoR/GlpR family transcriptional regulator of sugar metabolism|nr:DeoR/GlpR family DNA-binding transcription regulator [bacterium]MDD4557952.1 DeoR/GlpR family DNA-binding transcription regulator [bacterium]
MNINNTSNNKAVNNGLRDFKQLRQDKILALLDEMGKVHVKALAVEFSVDPITIRRDLEELALQNLLIRTHGGAVKTRLIDREFSYIEKEQKDVDLKTKVAKKAAALIENGDSVFFDTGTTARAAFLELPAEISLTIVTNNLVIVMDSLYRDNYRIIVPGGELNTVSPDLYGALTLSNLKDIYVNKAFFGCDAFDNDSFYTADHKSAETIKVMHKNSSQSFLLADSAKYGSKGLVRVMSMKEVCLITDDIKLNKHC